MVVRPVLAVFAAAAALLLSEPARGHSWYPERCCDENDCQQADWIHRMPDGTLILSRGAIEVRVPKSFPVEKSPDGKPHFCVWHSGISYEARCVFLPPES